MLWFISAMLAALGECLYYISIKKIGVGKSLSQIAPAVFLSSAGVLLLASLLQGIPPLQPNFWYYLVTAAIINIAAVALYFRAFQLEDISLTLPLISFTPIFLLLTSFIFLQEFPQPVGIIGIVLIVAGSYVLYSNGNSNSINSNSVQNWSGPFRHLFRNKSARLMLLVAVLFSVAANLGKLVILHSDPFFGVFTVHLAMGLLFLLWRFIQSASALKTAESSTLFSSSSLALLLVGLVLGITAIFESQALFQQIVPYVISVKRLSIFFGVLLGGMLFRERNLGRRILGALIMVIGVIVIALSS